MQRSASLFRVLLLLGVLVLLLNGSGITGNIISSLDIAESNMTIYAAFAFAIIVAGMFLVYLSRELHTHTELIGEFEKIEQRHEEEKERHHHGENEKKKRGREDYGKSRRLREIKQLVKEIKKI